MHHYAVHDGCTEVEVHHADVKLSGSVVHTILSDVNILSDSVNRGGISLKEYNATGYKTLIQQGSDSEASAGELLRTGQTETHVGSNLFWYQ